VAGENQLPIPDSEKRWCRFVLKPASATYLPSNNSWAISYARVAEGHVWFIAGLFLKSLFSGS
jgi:hypothetical protein